MSNTSVTPDPQVEHIGTAPHPLRNLMVLGGGVVLAGTIGLFSFLGGRSDKAAGAELDKFREIMFAQCKLESFKGPTDPQLAGLYADSSRMRGVVGEQIGNLSRGGANCEQIVKSLKSVDYPVP